MTQAGCLSNESVRVNSYWGTTIDRPPPGSVYDWSAESAHLEQGQDPNVARAIQENVERELAAIGYVKRAGTQAPDLLIYFHIGRGLQPSPSGPEQRASLGIRVFSASDGRVIYCASADALIDGTLCPEDRRARIEYAVHEIIRPLGQCPHGHSACSGGSNCGR
jgi:hypothetical protein